MIKICEICGKEFEAAFRDRARYCDACGKRRDTSSKWTPDSVPSKGFWWSRVCVICDKRFKPTRAGQATCSEKCQAKFDRQKDTLPKELIHPAIKPASWEEPQKGQTRKCVICGKEFINDCGHRLMCSTECAKERKRRMRKVEGQTRKCVICGKEFSTARDYQLTCSKECSREKRRRESNEWYKAHRKRTIEGSLLT